MKNWACHTDKGLRGPVTWGHGYTVLPRQRAVCCTLYPLVLRQGHRAGRALLWVWEVHELSLGYSSNPLVMAASFKWNTHTHTHPVPGFAAHCIATLAVYTAVKNTAGRGFWATPVEGSSTALWGRGVRPCFPRQICSHSQWALGETEPLRTLRDRASVAVSSGAGRYQTMESSIQMGTQGSTLLELTSAEERGFLS